MTAAPVGRAPKRDAQRPPDSRASLRRSLKRSCRAESSLAGVARSGGNSQCRRAGGLWAASATHSGRRPWAHRGMDERSVCPYTSSATRPMRATLTKAPAHLPPQPGRRLPAAATVSNCRHAPCSAREGPLRALSNGRHAGTPAWWRLDHLCRVWPQGRCIQSVLFLAYNLG